MDPGIAGRRRGNLATWLSERIGRPVVVRRLEVPDGTGFSNRTVVVDADVGAGSSCRLVLRMPPEGEGLFPTYDLAGQCALLRSLAATAVPVPRVLWFEPNQDVLGAAFYVVEHVDGRVLADSPPFTLTGWFHDLGLDDRHRLLTASLRSLAAIHAVDRRTGGFGRLGVDLPAGQALRDQLAYYHSFFLWGCGGRDVVGVNEAFDWAEENAPQEDETVLSWGDARLANQIFGPNLAVRAVLDWEMAGLGSRGLDLGWWLFFLRYHSDGIRVPLPDGIPARDELVAIYEQAAAARVEHVDYYEVIAALRSSVIQSRAVLLRARRGLLPDNARPEDHSPAVHLLAELLGQRAPSRHRPGYVRRA